MKEDIYGVLKGFGRQLCPPLLWKSLSVLKARSKKIIGQPREFSPGEQDLEVYWTKEMAQALETWGENTVWNEIQFFMVNCSGKVLDVACGTGKVMEILAKFPFLEVHGFDISDFLIQKAVTRGIPSSRLKVCDATKTDYQDDSFDHAYSIGSLEHFTPEGITKAFQEIDRIVKKVSFHMVPVSRSGEDEGWLRHFQSFHNNSVEWWLAIVKPIFNKVIVLNSGWNGDISVGKWLICIKE